MKRIDFTQEHIRIGERVGGNIPILYNIAPVDNGEEGPEFLQPLQFVVPCSSKMQVNPIGGKNEEIIKEPMSIKKLWLAQIEEVGLKKFGDIFVEATESDIFTFTPLEFVGRKERTKELAEEYKALEANFFREFYVMNFHRFHPESVAEAMSELTRLRPDISDETVAKIEKLIADSVKN